MRDGGDRVSEKESGNELQDVNMVSIGKLNVPQAVATAKTMSHFPTCDVNPQTPRTTWLLEGGWSAGDRKALAALFG